MIQTVNINVAALPALRGPGSFMVLSQNENGRQIRFRILGSDLPTGCTATFSGTKPDGNVYSTTGTVSGNFVIVQEDIQMTAVAGIWDAKLEIAKDTENIVTSIIRVTVVRDPVAGDAIPSDSQLDGIVTEVKYYAEHARSEAYGSPLTAPTKAQMTDHTRVYVYTGSEPNMVAGNWYHWNGTAWISGGVYNSVAVQSDSELNDFSTNPVQNKVIKAALDQIEGAIPEIDTTLRVAGKAADAKKTGDEISELKEDLNTVCGVSFTPNLIDNTYYSGAVGDTISTNSNSLSQAYTAVDLSDYVGQKVVVTYASKKTTTSRKTAMCNSSGVIGYVDSELKAENVFDITEDYPYLYVSCSDNNLSSIKTTGLIDDLSDDVCTLDTRVDALETGQAEVQSWSGASFMPVISSDSHYYTGDVGDTISTSSNSSSRTYTAIDLSDYVGRKVTVTYAAKMTVSNRKTAMCNSSGVIGYVDTEKNLTNVFDITEDYPYLYVSCSDNNLSSVSVNSVIDVIEGDIEILTPLSNPYNGLKYAALGDSITYGFRPRNDTTDPSPMKSYAELVAERLGMGFYNHGISASTVAYVADHNPMSRRWDDIPNDADIITVMGGANDIRQSVPVGTMEDRTDDTFYGALHVIFYGLYKKFYIDQGADVGKRKKIIAITPLKLLKNSPSEIGGNGVLSNLEPYVQAIKDVAAYYSCPCLDMYNLSQLNPSICCTVQGTDPNSPNLYTIYQPDGTHPTQAAAEMMADLLKGFLLTLK